MFSYTYGYIRRMSTYCSNVQLLLNAQSTFFWDTRTCHIPVGAVVQLGIIWSDLNGHGVCVCLLWMCWHCGTDVTWFPFNLSGQWVLMGVFLSFPWLGCWRYSHGSGCSGHTASRVSRGSIHPRRDGRQVKACGRPDVSRLYLRGVLYLSVDHVMKRRGLHCF